MPEIQMPKLSDTMTEGTLVAWKKKKGDQVSAGEVLAEIETDKATMEWESPEDGTLTEIYVPEGGKVNVGDKIGFIRGQGEDAPKEETPARKKKTEAVSEEKPQAETEKPAPAETAETETAPPQKKNAGAPVPAAQVETTPQKPQAREQKSEEPRVKASPVARRLAGELGVDLSTVKGTGPDGRVTETDVRAAGKMKSVEPARPRVGRDRDEGVPAPTSTRIQLSGMRKVIAQRLVESLGPVPHFYLTIDINAGPLMEAREELKSAGEGADAAKITVNDFVLKAAVMAAVKVPRVNASFDNDAIVQYADVDLGVAVAIDDGLLTPVVREGSRASRP
jgi:pyruvate dehydrogenase E2 component (dihydrolipoamide acetyltransferase)